MVFPLCLREAVLPRQSGTSKTRPECRDSRHVVMVVSRRLPHEAVKKFSFSLDLTGSLLSHRLGSNARKGGGRRTFVHVHHVLWMVGWSDDWLAPFHRGTKQRSAGGSGRYWRTHYYALGKMMGQNEYYSLSAMESFLLLLLLCKRGSVAEWRRNAALSLFSSGLPAAINAGLLTRAQVKCDGGQWHASKNKTGTEFVDRACG